MPSKSTPSTTPRSSRAARIHSPAISKLHATVSLNGSSGTKRKRVDDETSVYDDFDGAHDKASTPTKRIRASKAEKILSTKEPRQSTPRLPRSSRKQVTVPEESEGEGEQSAINTQLVEHHKNDNGGEQAKSLARTSTRVARSSRKKILAQEEDARARLKTNRVASVLTRVRGTPRNGTKSRNSRAEKENATVEIPDSEDETSMTNGANLTNGHNDNDNTDEDELASDMGTPTSRTRRREIAGHAIGRTPIAKATSSPSKRGASTAKVKAKAKDSAPTDDVPENVDPEDDVFTRSTRKSGRTKTSAKLLDRLRQASPLLENARPAPLKDVERELVVPSPARKAPVKPIQKAIPETVPARKHTVTDEDDFMLWKTAVLERVTGKCGGPLVGLDDEYAKVYQLALNTVEAGEGNSMLLIGARGSGKTALIKQALSAISRQHRDEFYTIYLNGFIHTDDKIALREIWRQLGKEMDVEDDGKNYADTLLKLLALLSHPMESGTADPNQVAKAVVFVMDEFDLFATHPRQTLLYNLFDIAQSRKAPIAVFGLTTRIDVGESLEKRVKSRFSHRYVHTSLPHSLAGFAEICQSALTLTGDGIQESTTTDLWNNFIPTLFADPSFTFNILAPHYYHTKCPSSFLSILTPYLSSLSSASFPPSSADILTSLSQSAAPTPPDSKLFLIAHLSTLALSLLIAACRLDIITHTPSVNFNMCYAEYVALLSKARASAAASGASAVGAAVRVWGREVARREWEKLVGWELVMPVVAGGVGGGGAGAVQGTMMVRADVSLEELGAVGQSLGWERVLEGWCKHI